MRGAQATFIGLFLAVLLGGVALVVLVPRLLRFAAGPEAEVIAQLKRTERPGLTLAIPGTDAPLRSSTHRYDRFAASLDPEGNALVMGCTLDFTGRLGAVDVGAFTVERLVYRYQDGDWEPALGLAPGLTGVVAALEARRQALQTLDREALSKLLAKEAGEGAPGDFHELGALERLRNRQYQATAWYIRVDGDEAVVTEDYRLTGDLPDRPVDRRASRRLSLRRSGREFFFWPGIM